MNTSLHNFDAMVDCRLHDQGKEVQQHINVSHQELGTEFQQRLDAVGLDFRRGDGQSSARSTGVASMVAAH